MVEPRDDDVRIPRISRAAVGERHPFPADEDVRKGFRAIEFTRSAAPLVAQNIRHMRHVRHRHRPPELNLHEHATANSIGKPVLSKKTKSEKFALSARKRPGAPVTQCSQHRRSHPQQPWPAPTSPSTSS